MFHFFIFYWYIIFFAGNLIVDLLVPTTEINCFLFFTLSYTFYNSQTLAMTFKCLCHHRNFHCFKHKFVLHHTQENKLRKTFASEIW